MQCAEAPHVQHGTQHGSGRSYGDVIAYECSPGHQLNDADDGDRYRLTDGRTETSIVCQQNEQWSESEVSCQRKSIVKRYLQLKVMYMHTCT